MTRAYVEAPATHFRLKPETWAIIAEEYRNGATAKDIGAKWKVAPSSVYRHACEDGWTKKSMGDARARAHARMVEEEEAAHRALNPVGSRALKSLFAPPPADDTGATDPGALAQAATLASGRAMKGRLWAEAKALAGLAETYARLESRQVADRRSGMTVDTVDLKLLAEILMHPNPGRRLGVWGDGPETPDYEVRKAYQDYRCDLNRRYGAQETARQAYRSRLEQRIVDLGGEVPAPPWVANEGWPGEEEPEDGSVAEDVDLYDPEW